MDKTDQREALNNTEEVSLKDIIIKIREWWKYLLSKWVIIVIAGVIGGAIGLAYAFSKKIIYSAELSFALEDDKPGGLSGAAGIASQFGIDLGSSSGGGAFAGDNLLALMKSRLMIEKALLTTVTIKGKTQTLAEFYISFNEFRESWAKDPQLKKIHFLPGADRSKFSYKQDSLMADLYGSLSQSKVSVAKADKKSSIIIVKVSTANELFSQAFSTILAKTVSDFYVETKTKRSVENVNILQHQVDSVRSELNYAITGVASSIDATPNANAQRQVLRVSTQRRQVDVDASKTILTQLIANLEISKVALRKETPLIQIIDIPILPLEKVRVSRSISFLIGGFLFSFITAVFLILKKLLTDILNN